MMRTMVPAFLLFALFFCHSRTPMVNSQLQSVLPDLDFGRSDFPKGFVFGTATSAYQVEGAATEGGRGPSIWDLFTRLPGKILDGSTGDVSADQYHLYEEDMDNLKSMNMQAYRFSISWSRIFPDGREHTVNPDGIAFYNRLIDSLLSRGIKPYVTLYHWDLPEALQEDFTGWVGEEVVEHFAAYAEACFAAFGDRVKDWITFNEPQQFLHQGYGTGDHAPGRSSNRSWSPSGDSATEGYRGAHHVLLAHAEAVMIYRNKFQASQGGQIGITLDCEWPEPMTNSSSDVAAAERRRLFELGWFLDPIFFGDYPAVMRENVGTRLPQFSPHHISLIRGSVDFIGLNCYTSRWVTSTSLPLDPMQSDFFKDQGVTRSSVRDGVDIGERANSAWLYHVPWGMQKLVLWTWLRYKTPIYITENGWDTKNDQSLHGPPPTDFLQDTSRITYYHDYLASLLSAIQTGADVRGYFAWSLVDNFEWQLGYTSRFGLFYVDYGTLKRYPKDSARWFAKFLQLREGDSSAKSSS